MLCGTVRSGAGCAATAAAIATVMPIGLEEGSRVAHRTYLFQSTEQRGAVDVFVFKRAA